MFEVCETVDTELFEMAVYMAVEKNEKNPEYIKGILGKFKYQGGVCNG